ncbi:AAR2 domain-containing protein [Blastomyces dermatitidis ATCC 18188]|uniref:AAR2 domain-containing protein n=1 Tax=Ajellomyces dermatitidis (strain ATCC 18188 / CBS 674.68) TaxID=653446 RepID=F2T5P4_AJEDA|nr:AAR2 domain-containing protein [Blastomyces dermatitidis ATCC 18188]
MSSQSPTPTVLLTSVPPKMLLGIDLLCFATTPNFHGIKNLPPGPHFLYTGTTESFSLRNGEWFFIHDDRTSGNIGGGGGGATIAAGGVDIRLRRWDGAVEALIPIDEGSEEGKRDAMRLRANLGRIWANGQLLAYDTARAEQRERQGDIQRHEQSEQGEPDLESESRQEPSNDWPQLTNHITPALLSRILGSTPTTTTSIIPANQNTTPPQPRWTVTSGSSAARDRDDIPGLSAADVARACDTGTASEQEKELRFLPVDLKRTWRVGAVGRERTEAAQDRSWALGDLVGRFGKGERGVGGAEGPTAAPASAPAPATATEAGTATTTIDDDDDNEGQEAGEAHILGELQFTFLMVLTLMNYSCLEQWKRLLGLILTCRAAVLRREKFFVQVLHLLRLQLRHFDDVEGGLFEMDGGDGGALLRKLLMRFSRTVQEFEQGEGRMVRRELGILENWVKGQYGWELRPGATVKRGMVELEDGERVEMEVIGAHEEDEMGEYAPVVVDLGEGTSLGKGLVEEVEEDEEAGESVSDVDMSEFNA